MTPPAIPTRIIFAPISLRRIRKSIGTACLLCHKSDFLKPVTDMPLIRQCPCRPARPLHIIRLRTFHLEESIVPVGTAFHERTFPLCHSLNYREWSGYYTVSVYEVHHEHEYNAIRNAAALIDITPLYKYLITGKDATKLVNRVITRDINKVRVGQVIYCCWCDEQGKVIDDGTITRLEETKYRWTAADPSLRWFRQTGLNMDVQVEDVSEKLAALALQGPTSGKLLKSVAEADIANL